jgi:hypothetical protein
MPAHGRCQLVLVDHVLGRKEIVMFFYLYAIIELLAFFLDSNIIPTANASYPVSAGNGPFSGYSLIHVLDRSSGLRQHTPVWSRPHIVVSSSMASLVSSSPRMAHLYHYGCGRSFLISSVRLRTKNFLGL